MLHCTASGLVNSMSVRGTMRLLIPNCSECRDAGVIQVDPLLRPKSFVLCDCQMKEFEYETERELCESDQEVGRLP